MGESEAESRLHSHVTTINTEDFHGLQAGFSSHQQAGRQASKQRCGGPQRGVLCCESVLALATWSRRRGPQVRARSSSLPPPPNQLQGPGSFTCLPSSGHRLVSVTSFLGQLICSSSSQNPGKHLCQFIMKVVVLQRTEMRRCTECGVGRVQSPHAL